MANILEDVQHYVVGKLSADWQLSGCCQFLAESIKDIDYEIKNALGRQGIVGVCMTPKATYAGKFEDLFLAWTLEELEIDIVENVTVNRGKKNGQWMTGQQIALRVFDVLCPLSGEFEGQFNPVSIEEGEDNGLVVNKCILKALVYGEHGDVPQPEKPITYQFVKLLDQPPPLSVQPHDGWMWSDDGQLFFYAGHEAHKLGDVTQSVMSAYVESQISSKADLSSVPTKTSDLSNDSGYLTEHQSLSDYYTKSETSSNVELDAEFDTKANLSAIPTKTSDLSNDSGFIEQNGMAVIHDLTCDQLVANQAYIAGYVTESDLSSKADLSAIPTKTSDLSNDSGFITSADVPTKTSDLTNDSGFITAASLTPYREKSDLYYEHSFHKANWQNVPRFMMDYGGTQTVFDKFDSTLDRWTVSTGTSDWYVQESLVGMEIDPQFTLMKLGSGIANILPAEGARTTTVTFIDMDVEGTFTMDMSDQLVCKVYVDRQLTALEARIAALEGN